MVRITRDTTIESQKINELYDCWRSLQKDAVTKLWSDFDVLDVFSIMPNVMMVDLEENPFRVKYRFVGTQVVRFTGFEFTGRYLDEIGLEGHNAPFYECYSAASAEGCPILEWCEWAINDGVTVSYDFAIFPFVNTTGKRDKALSIECYERLEKNYDSVEATLREPPKP